MLDEKKVKINHQNLENNTEDSLSTKLLYQKQNEQNKQGTITCTNRCLSVVAFYSKKKNKENMMLRIQHYPICSTN